MEFGIQLKKSGIPLTIVIQIPSSTDKDWNPVPGIQNPRLFWIPLIEIQLKRFCATFHTLPLFYLRTNVLRTYALKNYATVEIHNPPQGVLKVGESRFPGSNQIPYPVTFLDFLYRMLVKSRITGIPFQTWSEALPKTFYPPMGGNIFGRSYLVPAKA